MPLLLTQDSRERRGHTASAAAESCVWRKAQGCTGQPGVTHPFSLTSFNIPEQCGLFAPSEELARVQFTQSPEGPSAIPKTASTGPRSQEDQVTGTWWLPGNLVTSGTRGSGGRGLMTRQYTRSGQAAGRGNQEKRRMSLAGRCQRLLRPRMLGPGQGETAGPRCVLSGQRPYVRFGSPGGR